MLLDVLFKFPVAYFTIVFVLVASIVLHELGHALVATWEGDSTPRLRGHITWNPVVHMGWISLALIAVMGIGWGQTPVNRSSFRDRRWGAVFVSIAGPAVNLVLALVSAVVLVLLVESRHVSSEVYGAGFGEIIRGEYGAAAGLWWIMLRFNVLLFLFNMIPIPPLDGFGVVDGAFDLGDFGARVRQAGMFAFVIAILIVNSDAFDALRGHVAAGMILLVRDCVGG